MLILRRQEHLYFDFNDKNNEYREACEIIDRYINDMVMIGIFHICYQRNFMTRLTCL